MPGPPTSDAHPSQDLLALLVPSSQLSNPHPLTQPNSRLTNNLVTINVSEGPLHKAYHLDKDLLCAASPVFSTAFTSSSGLAWKETQDLQMNWPECSPKIFDIFVQWLHTGRLPSDSKLQLLPGIKFPMLQLLVFADRAMIPVLQQKCYEGIRYHLQLSMVPSKLFVQELYSIELSNDTLYRYITKLFAHLIFHGKLRAHASASRDPFDEMLESIPGFAVDMAKELKSVAEKTSANLSQYHNIQATPLGYRVPCDSPSRPGHPFDDPEFKEYTIRKDK
jgi:hypothetical protein